MGHLASETFEYHACKKKKKNPSQENLFFPPDNSCEMLMLSDVPVFVLFIY